MAIHRRRKSRGSLSIFSLDAFRSMSRAGSRQACHLSNDDDRGEKIDDNRPGKTKAPSAADSLFRPLPPATDEIVQPPQRALSDAQRRIPPKSGEGDDPKPCKYRPRSWFSPPTTSFDQKRPLPEKSIASTVGPAIISAPVLTSTTNARVAFTEAVHCREISAPGPATSFGHANSGCATDALAGGVMEDPFQKAQEMRAANGQTPGHHQDAQASGNFPKGHSKRSASMNTLSKVKEAVETRLRQASDPQTYRSVFRRGRFIRLEDECLPPSPIHERFARIRTEGRNLSRHKIRMLTGHGFVRRKPIRDNGHDLQAGLIPDTRDFLVDADTKSHAGRQHTDQNQSALNFTFEDLETSFSKAVENLDFRIKRDKASCASLSSLFHSARSYPTANQSITPHSPNILPSQAPLHLPSNAGHSPDRLSPQSTSDQLRSAPDTMGNCGSRMLSFRSGRGKAVPAVYSFQQQGDLAADQESDSAERDARAQRIFARGHCNPLASHPDLTKFADAPVLPTEHEPMPQGTPGVPIQAEEYELSGLEGAPIYSNSLETLNQYDRKTPPTAARSPDLPSRRLQTMDRPVSLIETPTRASGLGPRGRFAAARHERDVLGQSSTDGSDGLRRRKERGSRSRAASSRNGVGVDRKEKPSDRILRVMDQNTMTGAGGLRIDNGINRAV